MLFELISARYERRSMLITANQPFGEWNRVFPDPAMTLALSIASFTTQPSSR
nr:ATP-binding protein [Bradyrhizobium guangxiense]